MDVRVRPRKLLGRNRPLYDAFHASQAMSGLSPGDNFEFLHPATKKIPLLRVRPKTDHRDRFSGVLHLVRLHRTWETHCSLLTANSDSFSRAKGAFYRDRTSGTSPMHSLPYLAGITHVWCPSHSSEIKLLPLEVETCCNPEGARELRELHGTITGDEETRPWSERSS